MNTTNKMLSTIFEKCKYITKVWLHLSFTKVILGILTGLPIIKAFSYFYVSDEKYTFCFDIYDENMSFSFVFFLPQVSK